MSMETHTLERVLLENIGPFEELEVEFGPGWNLLIGDNGCGKSVLLRAIALCLCGAPTETHKLAGDLLKSGSNAGRIEIEIGPKRYQVAIRRPGPEAVFLGLRALRNKW